MIGSAMPKGTHSRSFKVNFDSAIAITSRCALLFASYSGLSRAYILGEKKGNASFGSRMDSFRIGVEKGIDIDIDKSPTAECAGESLNDKYNHINKPFGIVVIFLEVSVSQSFSKTKEVQTLL